MKYLLQAPSFAPQSPKTAGGVIPTHIGPVVLGVGAATIHIPPGDGVTQTAAINKDRPRVGLPCFFVLLGKSLKPFVDVPAMVFPSTNQGDLFVFPLSHITHPAITSDSIKGEPPRLPQSQGIDLSANARFLAGSMRVVPRNAVCHPRFGPVHINAMHFTQPTAEILRMTLGIFLRASITHGKVKHAIRTEGQGTTVVIVCGLLDGAKFSRGLS